MVQFDYFSAQVERLARGYLAESDGRLGTSLTIHESAASHSTLPQGLEKAEFTLITFVFFGGFALAQLDDVVINLRIHHGPVVDWYDGLHKQVALLSMTMFRQLKILRNLPVQ